MSSISAGTTSTTTLVHSGDTTGSLVFKTNDTGSGGTTAMTIDTSQKVGIGTSSPTQPLQINMTTGDQGIKLQAHNTTAGNRLSFADSSGTEYGLVNYDHGSDYMSFYTNSSERMRIDSSGNLIVGQTGVTQPPTSTAIICAGGLTINPSLRTAANAASVYWEAGTGVMWRSTSSLRYKTNVQDYSKGLNTVLALRAVSFNPKDGDRTDRTYAGFIAEEIDTLGLTEFVEYDAEGKPDSVAYSQITALLTKAIQELKAINDTQAQTITALTARISALENK